MGEEDGSPLLLVHGFGASSEHWRNNAAYFAEKGFRVYAIDLIGFGRSDQPSSKKFGYLDNAVWAQQVIAFLEEVVKASQFKKVSIIGNSLGGLVALTSLYLRPDLIKSIIASPLPDPCFTQKIIPSKSIWIKRVTKFLSQLFFHLIPLEIIIPLIVRSGLINLALQLAYYRSIATDQDLKRIVRTPTKRYTAANSLRAMSIGMSIRSFEKTGPELLRKLSKNSSPPEILLIWGNQDKLVPISLAKDLTRQYPWIKLLVIENSGHCPHDESPNQFNKFALNWLESS